MRLADQILATRGTKHDICGLVTSVSAGIEKAQRFSIDNEVAKAAVGVVRSRPSSLVAALPLCRLPYPKVWMEWSPDPSTGRGQGRDNVIAPVPWRMGVLIEANHESLQIGQMTWAWMHTGMEDPLEGVNVCPLSVVFDWREDGDLPATMGPLFDEDLKKRGALSPYGLVLKMMRDVHLQPYSTEQAAHDMRNRALARGWEKLANNPREIEAVVELTRHATPWVSNHAAKFISQAVTNPVFPQLYQHWSGDLEGEEPYAAALITMMNSKNAVEYEPADLMKINKSRAKRGRPEFLSYTTTKLRIAEHLRRAIRAGHMTREEARGTTVRGHFKLRKTGVYWWSPHERGDQSRPMPRREYEVVE